MAAEIPSVKPDILIIVSKLYSFIELFIDGSSAVTVVCPLDQSQVTFQPNTVKIEKRKTFNGKKSNEK